MKFATKVAIAEAKTGFALPGDLRDGDAEIAASFSVFCNLDVYINAVKGIADDRPVTGGEYLLKRILSRGVCNLWRADRGRGNRSQLAGRRARGDCFQTGNNPRFYWEILAFSLGSGADILCHDLATIVDRSVYKMLVISR